MPDNLQFVSISDFRPGIQQRTYNNADSTKSPPGAADPEHTFRCRAFPWGGLGPLPAMVQAKHHDDLMTTEDGLTRISGIHVTGPMQEQEQNSLYTGVDNVELHLAFEALEVGVDHLWQWVRFKIWQSAETEENIKSQSVTHADAEWDAVYRPTAFVDARMHATDATLLGDLFVVAGWHPDDMDSPSNVWAIFPDPAAPGATNYATILDENETTLMVQHQGRVISIDNHVFNHGGSGFWIVNDQLVWTMVNLPVVELDGSDVISVGVFTQGPVSGYGAVASVSAQEMLLVKHRGGATTLSGDIDDPTVFSFPGVTSTRGAVTYGVYTPVGFIYGVRDGGIHAWGGGDTSTKLSQNLDDDFWMMRPTEYPTEWRDFDGKFDITSDLVLCPNNWLYDIVTQSWWRIEDPDTYAIFQWAASPLSTNFWGTPVSFADGGVIYYRWDGQTLVNDYIWKSQYLTVSMDHVVEVRELSIRALSPTGSSTIVITLSNEAGDTQQEVFNIDNTEIPKLLRTDTFFQGTGIKVQIEASSADNEPAPIIYEVNLGYQGGPQEAKV